MATTHNITLIPGDGTGPEIVEATRRAIEATGNGPLRDELERRAANRATTRPAEENPG